MSPDQKAYKQKEAFCLMNYRCEDCGQAEVLWNSREWITPFAIGCAACEDGTMVHVDWEQDLQRPNYVPALGQRIFVDLTPELAWPKVVKYVDKHWDAEKMPMSEHPVFENMSKEEAVEHFVHNWCAEYGGHNPTVVVVDARLRQRIEKAALKGAD